MTETLRGSGHKPDIEALSALVDGQLATPQLSTLQAHLDGCDACTATLAELRQVRTTLRAMPEVAAPRSFRLRQADVEPARKPARAGWSPGRWAPALGGLAAVVFVVVFATDIRGRDNDSDSAAIRNSGELSGAIAEDDGSAVAADSAGGGPITPPDTGTVIAGPTDGQARGGVAPPTTPGEGAQPTSLSSDEPTPVIAADTGPTQTAEGSAPEIADPTGGPPAGDSPVPEAATQFDSTQGAGSAAPDAASTPAEGLVPAPNAPEGTLAARDEDGADAGATNTSDLEANSESDNEDGNFNWLLFVEVAAAAVAIAAGAYWLARRFAGGGAT